MKKASMETLVQWIDDHDATELFTIKDELTAELAKSKAKAEANRQVYADMHDDVFEVIRGASAPVTAQEIADETGLSRNKITWALGNIWADEVAVDRSGKVNTYTAR